MILSRRETLCSGLMLPFLLASRNARGAISAEFHRGINVWPWFSLTKEYPAPRTDYSWPPFQEQRPIPKDADLRRLRFVGFDFIRLPVDPGPFLSFSEAKRRLLMHSLMDAVESALFADLSVIVNVQANDSTHYWNSERMIQSTAAPAYELYRSLVGTIAESLERLKSKRVAFEPVNEPPQACNSSDWNDVQMALLSEARTRAPNLTLLATGSCGSMISGLEHVDPRPLLAFQPIIFTFHFYEPYLFSHQGAPWMREPIYRWLNSVPWPASAGSLERSLSAVNQKMAQDNSYSNADKASVFKEIKRVLTEYFAAQPDHLFLDHYLDRVSSWADANHVSRGQILMGEFGALRSDRRYTAANPADRVRYVRDVRRAVEAKGFSWAFWNLFDGMGLMDDVDRTLDQDIIGALGLTVPPHPVESGARTYIKRSQ